MKSKFFTCSLLIAASFAAHAQSTPAKKELVARIIKLQQPGIEAMARGLIEQPAAEILDRAGAALPSRVPADKREAVAKEIQADVRKYADDAGSVITQRAVRLAPTTIGPLLEEKFTEDELKQLIAIIESPVNRKYQALGPEMQRALGQKLVEDMKPAIEPKLRALNQSIGARLQPAAGAGASAPGK